MAFQIICKHFHKIVLLLITCFILLEIHHLFTLLKMGNRGNFDCAYLKGIKAIVLFYN